MQKQELSKLSGSAIDQRLRGLVASERGIAAEVIDYVREVIRRRLYLEFGRSSTFAYLTLDLGYTNGSAQRRIDAAKIMQEIPAIKEAPAAKVEVNEKRELLERMKCETVESSQVILAQKLDLEIKEQERTRLQKDESVRLEATLSKEAMEQLKRVKELISHKNPNPTWADAISFLAGDYVKHNDPLLQPLDRRRKAKPQAAAQSASKDAKVKHSGSATSATEAVSARKKQFLTKTKYSYISVRTRRFVFQLEPDHIVPRWAGGTDEPENLQLLCSAHNTLKYRQQAQLSWI